MLPETTDNRIDAKSSAEIRLALLIGARASDTSSCSDPMRRPIFG